MQRLVEVSLAHRLVVLRLAVLLIDGGWVKRMSRSPSSTIFHPSSRTATQRSHGSLTGSSIICPQPLKSLFFSDHPEVWIKPGLKSWT